MNVLKALRGGIPGERGMRIDVLEIAKNINSRGGLFQRRYRFRDDLRAINEFLDILSNNCEFSHSCFEVINHECFLVWGLNESSFSFAKPCKTH